jgi:Ca-activated chloride channel family protein
VTQPHLELRPLRPAVRADVPGTLDVLIRITPPTAAKPIARPPLNLALVLDRSGSMQGAKMQHAREAACYAVQQLLPTDRVSVTIFDNVVETLVPSTLAENKAAIVERLRQVHPRGNTALHPAWKAGGGQALEHRRADGLNRVLLLSDGLANEGETNADVICTDVKKLSQKGVSTTTLGVGQDYNEDLMEAMARSGDGNYYFIENPGQLPSIFQAELLGLMATLGTKVSLGVEPGEGVTVAEVLNDLDRAPTGRWMLPNLIVGMPLTVAVRLNVAPRSLGEAEVARFRLAWDALDGGRQILSVPLVLPAVLVSDYQGLAAHADVAEQVGLLQIGRLKKEATRHLDHGNAGLARDALKRAREILTSLPVTELTRQEDQDLAAVERLLDQGDVAHFNKMAKYQHCNRARSRPQAPPQTTQS